MLMHPQGLRPGARALSCPPPLCYANAVDTTYENIFVVLVLIATSRTNIKVAYMHVMIRDIVIVSR